MEQSPEIEILVCAHEEKYSRNLCRKCYRKDQYRRRKLGITQNTNGIFKESNCPSTKQKLTLCGITIEEFTGIYERQRGQCQICGNRPDCPQRFYPDTDTHTGFLMGLLCQQCFQITQLLRDRKFCLPKIMEYLRQTYKGEPVPDISSQTIYNTESMQHEESYVRQRWRELGQNAEKTLPTETPENP